MIGADSNFLLRVLLQDDVNQARAAESRLREIVEAKELLYVSSVVLAEVTWVLRRAWKSDRKVIADAISSLLTSRSMRLEDEEVVKLALTDYRRSTCDFADALIGRLAERAGCATTWTFDRKAAALPTFTAADA